MLGIGVFAKVGVGVTVLVGVDVSVGEGVVVSVAVGVRDEPDVAVPVGMLAGFGVFPAAGVVIRDVCRGFCWL